METKNEIFIEFDLINQQFHVRVSESAEPKIALDTATNAICRELLGEPSLWEAHMAELYPEWLKYVELVIVKTRPPNMSGFQYANFLINKGRLKLLDDCMPPYQNPSESMHFCSSQTELGYEPILPP